MYRPGSSKPVSDQEFRRGFALQVRQIVLSRRHVDMLFDKANDNLEPVPSPRSALMALLMRLCARAKTLRSVEGSPT